MILIYLYCPLQRNMSGSRGKKILNLVLEERKIRDVIKEHEPNTNVQYEKHKVEAFSDNSDINIIYTNEEVLNTDGEYNHQSKTFQQLTTVELVEPVLYCLTPDQELTAIIQDVIIIDEQLTTIRRN